jgi:DNA invertase Pin-like site-specific DNA recombinase
MNAVAYFRVSGKSQVEGDGFPRQQAAIESCAKKQDLSIIRTFREEGVSGVKDQEERPAFVDMVNFILDNPNTQTIVVENLTRLARAVRVQENILFYLASKGIDLISADTGENITAAIREDPMKEALIQIQAVFSQLEKKSLVRKLRVARERKKLETGRCEGQKPYGTKPGEAGVLTRLLELREEGRTIREVVERLNADPQTRNATRNQRPWTLGVVARILSRHMNPEFS